MIKTAIAGPVLVPSEMGLAIVAAIRASNVGVQVEDRGAYLRVSAGSRCVVTRQAIEAALGRPVQLPGDLEQCMPSFRGRLRVDPEHAVWEARAR